MKTTREEYLTAAMNKARPHFEKAGYTIPQNVRVSCGLPSTKAFASTKRAIGEAWASTNTRDKHFEIFISPTIDDPRQVLTTLVHELVHVTVGLKAGHKGQFIECARKVGLLSPWTQSAASDDLADRIGQWISQLGDYPHAALTKMTNGQKKQTTRLIKCNCPECGYTIRTTMKWLLTAEPVCPDTECKHHGQPMETELPEEDREIVNV